MSDYSFNKDQFVIENYLEKAPFSDFLPGVAGELGIPLWAFFVNRGQGIAGFGLQNKNHPIMEFFPANKAYEMVSQIGFRTFLKVNGTYYEPFVLENGLKHRMKIDRASFTIEEENEALGVSVRVTYFGLPNESLGALARKTEVFNISDQILNIEMLDGLARVLPSGVKNNEFQAMSNLLVSWMDVEALENNYAFYKLRSSTGDTSEVKAFKDGNFLLGIVDQQLVEPIVDEQMVFGIDSAKHHALSFKNHPLSMIRKSKQVTVNKIPCGFIPLEEMIKPGDGAQMDQFYGYTYSKESLQSFIDQSIQDGFMDRKLEEAKQVIETLVKDVHTETNIEVFDEYIKQSYLDNLLRGGYPKKMGNTIYHLYSRRHGDLERDYNFFSLSPEFYSQGAGNFRDVCQNRRLDSVIHRDVEAHNIKHFASLIQLDGYNPLTIHGLVFQITSEEKRRNLVGKIFESHQEALIDFLSHPFSPGGLVQFITLRKVMTSYDTKVALEMILKESDVHYQSTFSEGYWVDHFTYLIDLVENYEAFYPDRMETLLYNARDILTFDSPVSVLPRNQKAVETEQGRIRQFGSLLHFDQQKVERLGLNPHGTNWVKTNEEVYKTNLFTKLMILVLNKHSQLDASNIGIEMEAEKPGWNDAMNGLPGLFGSGVSETIELKRIVAFLLKYPANKTMEFPKEVFHLMGDLKHAKTYGDRIAARETYREHTRFGLSGLNESVDAETIESYLKGLNQQIQETLNLLLEEDSIPPTFVVHQVDQFEPVLKDNHRVIGNYGLPLVRPLTYQKRYLPKFLEAPARLLKLDIDKERLLTMVEAIKQSDMYDKELGIYKTSEKLEEEGYDIGRIRAFTAGWLERESDFLHMNYKYMLGLLKAGLYEQYFEEIQKNLVCFMNPEVYGRNPLQNSSFIAPSNNDNPLIHGKGFLPRLSGSTIEGLDMWFTMMTGGTPFRMKGSDLIFKLEPKLSKDFFKKYGKVSFTFMKDTLITIHNSRKVNTYESCEIFKIILKNEEVTETFYQDYVDKHFALNIREGFYTNIEVYIK